MKKKFFISFAILITSAFSIIIFSCATGNPTYSESVIQTKLYSKILKEDREVIIHLPIGYDENKKYPVMYVLDGSSQDKHITNKFRTLSSAGYAPETIVVGLPNVGGKGRKRDYTPPFMRMDIDKINSPMGEGDKFLSFMETELIPYIETKYSVSKSRSLAGNSRGGLLVMYSLVYNPDLFQGRFCFSPAFWRDDSLIVKKVDEYLSTQAQSDVSFIFMSLGSEENIKMKNGFDQMITIFKDNPSPKIVWHSNFTEHANHQNNAEISASVAIRKWADYLNGLN